MSSSFSFDTFLQTVPKDNATFHLAKNKNIFFIAKGVPYSRDEQDSLIAQLAQSITTLNECPPLATLDRFLGVISHLRIDPFFCLFPDKGNLSDSFPQIYQAVASLVQKGRMNTVFIEQALNYLVEQNDFCRFCYMLSSHFSNNGSLEDFEREKLNQVTGNRPWLEKVKKNPSWVSKLLSNEKIVHDLCDVPVKSVEQFLQKLDRVQLSLTQDELVYLAKNNAFAHVRFLDLRYCSGLHWPELEKILLKCPQLENVIFPENLYSIISNRHLHDSFDTRLHYLITLQLIRISGKKGTPSVLTPTNASDRCYERFTQFDEFAQFLVGHTINLRWERVSRLFTSFLLQDETLRKKATFSATLHLEMNGQVTTNLLRELTIANDTPSYYLDFCPGITDETIQMLLNRHEHIDTLSLFGCSQITEDAFKNSKGKIKRLIYTKPTSSDFEKTGILPLLTVESAKRFIEESLIKNELKRYAKQFLCYNVTRDNVFDLYNLAKKHELDTLLFVTRSFIELFLNPFHPRSGEKIMQEAETILSFDPAPRQLPRDLKEKIPAKQFKVETTTVTKLSNQLAQQLAETHLDREL